MSKVLKFLIVAMLMTVSIFAKEPLKTYKEGQKLYVWAVNGMNFREEGKSDGKVISLLSYGTEVEVMGQSDKVEYTYVLKNPSKSYYSEGSNLPKPVTLNGYWLKVRVGDTTGYVFDKLLLSYEPYLGMNSDNRQYFINYLARNLKLQLVNDELKVTKETEDGDDYYYNSYKQLYLSKDSKNKVILDDSDGYDIDTVWHRGSITIGNMSFQEGLVFFTAIMKSSVKDYYYDYKEDTKFEYELDEVSNGASLNKIQNGVNFEWAYYPD